MLRYGRFRVLLDTVPEGVMVTVHDNEGFVCEVIDVDAMTAVLAALEAAEASDEDGFDAPN
ncbi:MAG: hypothetical protein JWN44_1775 [Myxococcales bacterium]|nr:hypothetical protein [Myxococcales bacterium]